MVFWLVVEVDVEFFYYGFDLGAGEGVFGGWGKDEKKHFCGGVS